MSEVIDSLYTCIYKSGYNIHDFFSLSFLLLPSGTYFMTICSNLSLVTFLEMCIPGKLSFLSTLYIASPQPPLTSGPILYFTPESVKSRDSCCSSQGVHLGCLYFICYFLSVCACCQKHVCKPYNNVLLTRVSQIFNFIWFPFILFHSIQLRQLIIRRFLCFIDIISPSSITSLSLSISSSHTSLTFHFFLTEDS